MGASLNILNCVGALAFFVYGMKMLSDSMQTISRSKLQYLLDKSVDDTLRVSFIGALLSFTLQSSSSAMVFVLSFVNSGLIQLKRALSFVIGANIGSTFTAWCIVLGLYFELNYIALLLFALGVPFFFIKKRRFIHWGEALMGLAIVFIALNLLKHLIDLDVFWHFLEAKDYQQYHFISALLFVLISVFVTLLLRFSTVSILLYAILLGKGLPLELALMMVMGANIGSALRVQLTAITGNMLMYSVAKFHLFYNLLGALLFFFLIPSFIYLFEAYLTSEGMIILAAFHTFFNLVVALIIFPFLNKIVAFINAFLSKNKQINASSVLKDFPFEINAEIYLYEAHRETMKFAGITKQIIHTLKRLITESDEQKFQELKNRILHLEQEGDQIEKNLKKYLKRIYHFKMNGEVYKTIYRLMDIGHHLETVGDLAIKTAFIHEDRRKNNSFFTPKLRSLLFDLQDALSLATTTLIQNLNENEQKIVISTAKTHEKNINSIHEQAQKHLFEAIEKEQIPTLSALYYKEMIQNYEIIGDHLFKANKALKQ